LVKITVVGHIVLDTISSDLMNTTSIGGPPIYAGLTARNMGGEVTLLTKYGKDLPEENILWLLRNQINIPDGARSTTHPTTRFMINQTLKSRYLQLKARCEDIIYIGDEQKGDAAIVSPVAREVNITFLSNLRQIFETIYLDPQGFIRRFRSDGRCFLGRINKNVLKYADILKMDKDEAYNITGSKDYFKALQKTFENGVKISIYTRGSEGILLRCNKGLFRIPVVKKVKILDMTGLGDIFAGAFTFTYLKDNDPIWAGAVATAASSLALDKISVSKIPEMDIVTEVAEETMEKIYKI